MRKRLALAFILLTIAVLAGAGIVRSIVVRDLIREQAAKHLQQESVLIAEIVADRQASGGSIDQSFLEELVGEDSRLEFDAYGLRPIIVQGVDYNGTDDPATELSSTVETYGASVTVSQSDAVLGEIFKRDISSLLIVYVFIGLLAGFLGFVFARMLSKPFRELATAAAALGRGRFDLEVPETRIPEARAIGQALKTSAGQLEDRLHRERDFAEHASHVLRSPLTGLRLELEDLTMRPEVPIEARVAAARGIKTIDEMNSVAGELVEMSRSGILVAGAELPLVELATQLAQRWADRLAARNRTLTASAEGDLSLSYTPGPVEHVFDLVMAEVVRRGTGPVHIVYRGQEGGHLRIKIAALGRASDLTGSEPETRLEEARSVVAALGGRINGDDPAHGTRGTAAASLTRLQQTGRMTDLSTGRPVETWLTDMDGVLVHEDVPIPGAQEFVEALKASGLRFLVLTNNSIFTPRDLRARLLSSGIDVPEDAIWTSALATAQFLADQRPRGTAYVVGESGLTSALHDIGYVLTDRDPDYVVLGETRTYSFEAITTAIRLVEKGARFIATNPDVSGPSVNGTLPATGSVAALIRTATGRAPYFIGKPNPLMMRSALNRLDAHSEATVMVGDRMETDIISGLEAGLRTVLVMSGSTRQEQIETFPYRPTMVVDSVADLVDQVHPL